MNLVSFQLINTSHLINLISFQIRKNNQPRGILDLTNWWANHDKFDAKWQQKLRDNYVMLTPRRTTVYLTRMRICAI